MMQRFEPCRYHQQGVPPPFIVVRCAHLGDEYINDMHGRVVRVVARIRGLDVPEMSEYLHVASDHDADLVWAEMHTRMLEGAPFGEPYECGKKEPARTEESPQ